MPKFTLSKMPYSYDTLEPYFDAKTMEIHYTKHHQTYVDKLNDALNDYENLLQQSLETLLKNWSTLPEAVRMPVRNFGGGHLNHTMFWESLQKGGGKPSEKMAAILKKSFGSFSKFQEEFTAKASSLFEKIYNNYQRLWDDVRLSIKLEFRIRNREFRMV